MDVGRREVRNNGPVEVHRRAALEGEVFQLGAVEVDRRIGVDGDVAFEHGLEREPGLLHSAGGLEGQPRGAVGVLHFERAAGEVDVARGNGALVHGLLDEVDGAAGAECVEVNGTIATALPSEDDRLGIEAGNGAIVVERGLGHGTG